MAKRKETPDILAEIMGGETNLADQPAPPPAAKSLKSSSPTRKSAQSSRPSKSAAAKSEQAPEHMHAAAMAWEYRVVSFQYHLGWRLRFMDGVEVPDWTGSPRIHEFLMAAGNDGWELVSSTSGQKMFGLEDNYQLFLRRVLKA